MAVARPNGMLCRREGTVTNEALTLTLKLDVVPDLAGDLWPVTWPFDVCFPMITMAT